MYNDLTPYKIQDMTKMGKFGYFMLVERMKNENDKNLPENLKNIYDIVKEDFNYQQSKIKNYKEKIQKIQIEIK